MVNDSRIIPCHCFYIVFLIVWPLFTTVSVLLCTGETEKVNMQEGGRDLSIGIAASAQYLTIAMLNGDDSTSFDDQVWLDPTLTIVPSGSLSAHTMH